MTRPKITIGASLVLIAALACGFAVLRTPSETRAVQIAKRRFRTDNPGTMQAQASIRHSIWDWRLRRWEIRIIHDACSVDYYVGPMGCCWFEPGICI